MIDTHCHLNADVFEGRVESLLKESKALGVRQFFVVGWNQASSEKAVELAKRFPEIKAIVGLHPVDTETSQDLAWLTPMIENNRESIIAVGEIGFDYYWHKETHQHTVQAHVFDQQMTIAERFQLPVVIHCRDAYDALLMHLQNRGGTYRGIMHCFGGTPEQAKGFLDLGFDLSFGGPITFKNAHIAREVLKNTPLDRLHLETDSPYLAPHPYRGQENTPTLLPIVFEKACEVLEIPARNLESMLEKNVDFLFHVKTK